MGILAELLAEVEEVKGLRASVDAEKKVAAINLAYGESWYRKFYTARQMARVWKRLAKHLLWCKNVAEASRDIARKDRSFAENRNETLSTELEEAHKLIDTLRKQCKDDHEDIEELREQRNASDAAFAREYNKCGLLTGEVCRLYSENYELREKLRCGE